MIIKFLKRFGFMFRFRNKGPFLSHFGFLFRLRRKGDGRHNAASFTGKEYTHDYSGPFVSGPKNDWGVGPGPGW